MIYRSVYQCKETGKKAIVRRVDGVSCIVHDIISGQEKRMSQTAMRKVYKYLKKESTKKRWEGEGVFYNKRGGVL